MNLNSIKQQEKELIKNLIIEYIYSFERKNFYYNKETINEAVNKYINEIKLSEDDYAIIKQKVIENLLIKSSFSNNYEASKIISILSKKINNFTFEYTLDDKEICLYFHLKNNTSYLVNYDDIEDKWYIALIETNSLNIIEEIYSGKYLEFINFISNLKSR